MTDDKGNAFYLIQVRTDKNHLGGDNKPLLIIPGMTATVDIITGHKSVLDYLLKPVLKARAEAWRPWRAYAAAHLWHNYSEG